MLNIDSQINYFFEKKKNKILYLAKKNKAEECMQETFNLWMFMNRFRNCDLQNYFNEDIHNALISLNYRDTKHEILKKKKL